MTNPNIIYQYRNKHIREESKRIATEMELERIRNIQRQKLKFIRILKGSKSFDATTKDNLEVERVRQLTPDFNRIDEWNTTQFGDLVRYKQMWKNRNVKGVVTIEMPVVTRQQVKDLLPSIKSKKRSLKVSRKSNNRTKNSNSSRTGSHNLSLRKRDESQRYQSEISSPELR